MRIKIFKFVFSIVFSFTYSHAANTITQGQSIKDGQILTSLANNFALGFFSPKNSSNRYVGIWYNNISEKTVVWVANRNNPITTSSGVFAFGNDRNLHVLDGSGKSLWSSNISSANGNTTVTAILMDTGNLVLSLNDNVIDPDAERALWQSFDDPTDTFLPGKRVWLSPKSTKDIFVSWKSESDPSVGNFSMGLNPEGLMEVMLWEGLKRRWRSGLWNGHLFIGVPNMPTSYYLFGYRVDEVKGRNYFTYVVHNSSEIMRSRMKWDGTEEQLRWDKEKEGWTRFFAWPTRPCELYNTCGQFGMCSASSKPICSCVQGFEPQSDTEWDSGNWTRGCVRRTQLLCNGNVTSGEVKADGFLELRSIHLPDFSVFMQSNGEDDCRSICLNNCSCKAYSYVDGIQCLTWSGDLRDIQIFQVGGQKLFVRLAAFELPDKQSGVILVIILVFVLAIVLLGISTFLFWRYRAKLRGIFRKGKSQTKRMDESREFWSEQADGEYNKGNRSDLIQYSFQKIEDATNSFSSENELGKGGFGPVYKGNLASGKIVAVKRLSSISGQGMEEFKNELILIAKLQHRNLVRLLGYCVEGEEKMLVYEYMPNKSLDAFIFGKPQVPLDWGKRFSIIEGIARGLLYLHRDSRLRIIHRDLKVSNILLDEEMTPKISDFGMAKIFGGSENQANTVRVVGTYGYMAPEYAMEGLFSVKSDVYSFGVVLLEIISGKKNKFFYTEYCTKLIDNAWMLWSEDRAMEFIDPSIRDTCSQADAFRCLNIGLLCVQDSNMHRPVMSTVVLMLESDTAVLPSPRQPTYIARSNRIETGLSSDNSNAHSINNVTASMVIGR